MEKLYRFRKPKAYGKYQVMFRHIPGKWMSTGTDNYAEAVLWAEAFLKRDLQVNDTEVTLRQFAKNFFTPKDPYNIRQRNNQHGRVYDETYYENRQSRLKNYILPRFGDQLVDTITDVTIEDWFLNLTRKNGKSLSADTKNKILITLEEILQEAHRQGLVSTNQASQVSRIVVHGKPRDGFTPEEMRTMFPKDDVLLINVWGDLMWSTYFLVFRDTGFRPGEIAALTKDNYLEKYHGLYSTRSVNYKTKEIKDTIKTSRKGQDYKVGILTSQTERFLKRLIEDCEARGRSLLFFSNEGNPITPPTSNKHFKSCLKGLVDLNGRTQYCMRHSFETDIAGDVEDKVLLELMAHTKFRKEYDHRTPERRLSQLQPVRDLLEKRGDPQK